MRMRYDLNIQYENECSLTIADHINVSQTDTKQNETTLKVDDKPLTIFNSLCW